MYKSLTSELQAAAKAVPERRRLWMLNWIEEHHRALLTATQRRKARQELLRKIDYLARPVSECDRVYGYWSGADFHELGEWSDNKRRRKPIINDVLVIGVIVWSRDCDHVCGEHMSWVRATARDFDAYVDYQLEYAEGPMTFEVVDPKTKHKRWSRDMVMEAYEDGHPHVVTDAHQPWLPESAEACEFGQDEYDWRLKQAGL